MLLLYSHFCRNILLSGPMSKGSLAHEPIYLKKLPAAVYSTTVSAATPFLIRQIVTIIQLLRSRILQVNRIIQCFLHLRLYFRQIIIHFHLAGLYIGNALKERIPPLCIIGISRF